MAAVSEEQTAGECVLAGLSARAVILSFLEESFWIPVELSHAHTQSLSPSLSLTHMDGNLSIFGHREVMDKETHIKTKRQNTHNGDILDVRNVKR